jgi:hypothetical protein
MTAKGVGQRSAVSRRGAAEEYPGDDVAAFEIGGRMFALVALSGDLVHSRADSH